MGWDYDPALATLKDQVRLVIGDTDPADKLMNDEEIIFFADLENQRLYETAADCAESLSGKFARQASSKSVGSMSLSIQRYEHYSDLATMLRQKSVLMLNASPLVGGISISDKEQTEADEDRVKPKFTKNQFEEPSPWPGNVSPEGFGP